MSDQFGKAFCVLPWIHSFVNIGGEYQVCCTSEEFHKGIPNNLGKFFNIKDQPSIDEVMNSDFLKKIRLDMLDGQLPKLCGRCVITEKNGGGSRRTLENRSYFHLIDSLIESTQPDGSIPVNIICADYRLGNICNLQCRMCNPRSTVMWLKEWETVKSSSFEISPEKMKEYSNYNWIDEDYLLEEFDKKIQSIKTLHFAGGEPLIAPRMREMLQICVDRGIAGNISLTYNTNITKLPEKVLELWKHFKEVRLLCSIDGFGKVNDYIRMPSKWDNIDKNLTFLDENARDLKLTDILLSTTVQAYNILNLNDLFQYLSKFKNICKIPNLIDLYSPDYLMTQVLPPHLKKEATSRMMKIHHDLDKKKFPGKEYLIDNIHQILNFMNSRDLHQERWGEFVRFNSKIDNLKGMSMQDCIPELYEAIDLSI
jgi:sulfatase maturation enzyme AslB (radical SAM superfamily)